MSARYGSHSAQRPERASKRFVAAGSVIGLAALAGSLMVTSAAAQSSAQKTQLIVDASGSMWGAVNRTSKIKLTRRAIIKAMRPRTAGVPVGLFAYGHRRRRSCTDVEQVVPAALGNREVLAEAVEKINPRGRTPMASALEQSAATLGDAGGSVVLITDGAENCDRDPCAVVRATRRNNPLIRFDVIALAMSDADRRSVQCVARLGGGELKEVSSVDQMHEALDAILTRNATTALARVAPEAKADETPASQQAAAEKTAEVARAGQDAFLRRTGPSGLKLRAQAMAAGGILDDDLEWRITRVDDAFDLPLTAAGKARAETARGETYPAVDELNLDLIDGQLVHAGVAPGIDLELPAGRYLVFVRWGLASRAAILDIASAEELLGKLTIDAGRIQLTALANRSGERLNDVFFTVERLETDATASASAPGAGSGSVRGAVVTSSDVGGGPENRARVVAMSHDDTPELQLPPGTDRVSVQYGFVWGSRVVTVDRGTARRVDIVLGVGRLKLSALTGENGLRPDGVLFRVLEDDPTSPIGRRRREVARSSAAEPEFQLRAGTFYALAQRGTVTVEQTVTVYPGQVTAAPLAMPASTIRASARIAGDQEPVTDAINYTVYKLVDDGGQTREQIVLRTAAAQPVMQLGVGRYRVVGVLGGVNAAIAQEVDLAAGDVLALNMEFQAGQVQLAMRNQRGTPLRRAVLWGIRDDRKNVIWRTSRPEPSVILSAGTYELLAEQGGKRQVQSFNVEPGAPVQISITMGN